MNVKCNDVWNVHNFSARFHKGDNLFKMDNQILMLHMMDKVLMLFMSKD